MANLLNREGAAAMICDCLRADTTILYGTNRLVQTITSDPTLFLNAKTDIRAPYKMYVYAADNTAVSVRAQNADELFVVNFRIEGLAVNMTNVFNTLDKIDQQVTVLVNSQMYTGAYFRSYYTDSKARLIDAERSDAGIEVAQENGTIHAECRGAINILVNRLV